MIDALYSGISGLNANQNALNTQSNNLANVNTVGFKSDNISFADLMYEKSIGKGVMIDAVSKNFSQGNLKSTNNDYDLAIEGPGYFIVKGDSAENLYTRAGNFQMAKNGNLQTVSGYNVQGIISNAPIINGSDINDLSFNDTYTNFIASKVIKPNDDIVQTINVKSSDYLSTVANDDISNSGNNYKTKEAKITDINTLALKYRNELNIYESNQIPGITPSNQISTIQYDTNNLSELSSIEITIDNNVYKSIYTNDIQTTLNTLANDISNTKALSASIDNNGLLSVKSLIPGEKINLSSAKITNSSGAIFNSNINTIDAISGSGKAKLDAIENQLKSLIENAGGKFLKITNTVDTSDINNKQLSNLQLRLDNLNISNNPFGQLEIDNGVIFINQDGSRFAVGKVMTSMFTSEQGLIPKGSNVYAASRESGEAIYATGVNKILNKTLELSNSSVAEGLVDLMIFQRSFEANSKSITTSDEFLKTAIQLKK